MSRKRQMDRLIDVAAGLDKGPGRGGGGGSPDLPDGDIELITASMAQDVEVPELPERLVRSAVARYPAGGGAVDLIVSYLRGALKVMRASADIVLSGPAGAAVAVRSEGAAALPFVSMSRKFNRAHLSVIIEGDGAAGCTFTVQASDAATRSPLGQSRVELISGWRELASAPLVDGRAQFEEVRPGRYELVVRKNEAVLGMMTIQIVP